MNLILYNGMIRTMNNEEIVTALAVRQGLIEATGSDVAILKLRTPDTKVIDLQGKLVIPGFNDAHIHVLNYGLNKSRLDLNGCMSVAELIERGKDYLRINEKVTVLLGRGWNQDYFTDQRSPVKADLDKISTEVPIIFTRVCGHCLVANSRALEHFNIERDTPCPSGGSFEWDSGTFYETATDMFRLPKLSVEEIMATIKGASADFLRKGITSVQSDDFGTSDYKTVMAAYQRLAETKQLGIRVYQQCLFDSLAEVEAFITDTADYPEEEGFYRLGPIKLLADGSLGARSAFLSKPYEDDPSTIGIACFTQEELDDIVTYCHRNNKAVAVHCIGDGMLERILNSVEKARAKYPNIEDIRHGVVHCQISNRKQLQKLRELEMVAYIQPIFLDYDLHIVEARVGKDLASSSYNFKTMIDQGVVAALSTDCPVELFDPLNNIYCAVTRKDLKGKAKDAYNPNQALSVAEAVYGYSVAGAYCSYEENVKGRLSEGYYADMVVLDTDIFGCKPVEIMDTKIEMTIVNGEISYKIHG